MSTRTRITLLVLQAIAIAGGIVIGAALWSASA